MTELKAFLRGGVPIDLTLSGTKLNVSTPAKPPVSRISRGFGYSAASAKSKTGIARLGLTVSDMTLYTGPDTIPAGSVLTRKLFTRSIDLRNGGITISESIFRPEIADGWNVIMATNWDLGHAPALVNEIRDCEITGEALGTQNQSRLVGIDGLVNVTGCDIHHLGSGIAVRMAGGTTFPTYIQSNYVHNLISFGDPAGAGNHCDGFTVRDYEAGPGRHLYVSSNWFDCTTANATGACFLQAQGSIFDVTLTTNLFDGGGWNFMLGNYGVNTYGRVCVVGNRFRPTGFGTAHVEDGPGPMEWLDNYLLESSPPNFQGTEVLV